MATARVDRSANFLSKDRFLLGEDLLGDKDSLNTDYTTPDNFLLDFNGGFFLKVERNGQSQVLGSQYTILSSGGVGIGIRFIKPPKKNDTLTIDYIKA